MGLGRLHGQRAIITGAASGIGRATAELFAAEGARVLAVDLPGSEREWCSEGITSFEADESAEGTPRRIACALEEQFGGVDIVFNKAGIYRGMPLADMTDAVWDEVFATTLRAGFRLCRELIPMLREAPTARIISTSSTSALVTISGQAAYACAKAGLIALVRAMALELGPDGITSNAIQRPANFRFLALPARKLPDRYPPNCGHHDFSVLQAPEVPRLARMAPSRLHLRAPAPARSAQLAGVAFGDCRNRGACGRDVA